MNKQEQVEKMTTYMAHFVDHIGKVLPDDIIQKLDELAMYLYEKETITGEEFMNILNGGKTDNTDKNKLEVNAADEDRKEAEQNEQKN